MDRIERARQRLIFRPGDSKAESIRMLMGQHGGVNGLAVAGASGLLALVYPEEFGTVDVMVTRVLQQLGIPDVKDVNPKKIKLHDAQIMIEIMKHKAIGLNQIFGTNKWTPRLVDRVLWVAGR